MLKYAINPKANKSVKVHGRNIRVSTKHSAIVCKAISGTTLEKAHRMLESVIAARTSINGKYFTKTSSELLLLLGSAKSNAEFKGFDAERMMVHASAHRGFSYSTPRRFKLARRQGRMTNLQIVLEVR